MAAHAWQQTVSLPCQHTFMSLAFSRMYLPSLYFWLSSKARSCSPSELTHSFLASTQHSISIAGPC